MFLVPQNAGNGIYTFKIFREHAPGPPSKLPRYARSTHAQAKNLTLIHFFKLGSTVYQKLAEYYYVRQLLSIFLFILYTGSNSGDPDEMQQKVAFYQDLHCQLQGLKNIILYILHIPYITYI